LDHQNQAKRNNYQCNDYLFDCSPHVLKVQVMTSSPPFNPLLLFKILDE